MQSFTEGAPEMPKEEGDFLQLPAANRPQKAIAVQIEFGRTATSLPEHCFSASAGKKGVHCFSDCSDV
jgi:hypothetical protein